MVPAPEQPAWTPERIGSKKDDEMKRLKCHVIHCTTAPGEALMQKCQRNINGGLRPIIVTTYPRVIVAESLASDIGLGGRIEVWDIEQFLATNVYELSFFKAADRKVTVERIIEAYNGIIGRCETDPSLRIELN